MHSLQGAVPTVYTPCRAKCLLYACLGCSDCCIRCLQSIMPAVYAPCRTQRLLYAFFADHNAWYIHSLQGTVPSVYRPAGHTACCMYTPHSTVDWGLGHKAHGGGGAGDEIVHLVALLAKPDFSLMPPRPEAPAQHTVAKIHFDDPILCLLLCRSHLGRMGLRHLAPLFIND